MPSQEVGVIHRDSLLRADDAVPDKVRGGIDPKKNTYILLEEPTKASLPRRVMFSLASPVFDSAWCVISNGSHFLFHTECRQCIQITNTADNR